MPKKMPKKTKTGKPPAQKKTAWTFCRRTGLVCFELTAVFVFLLLLVAGLFVWRLTSGPVDVGFTREYIEQALHDPARDVSVKVEQVVLEWPELDSPLLLGLKDVRIVQAGRKDIMSVDEVGLSLSIGHLLIGQIKPHAIIVRKPSLRLIRRENNNISLGFEEHVFEQPDEQDKEEPEADAGQQVADILNRLSNPDRTAGGPLSELESVEIESASLMIEDHAGGISWFLPQVDFDLISDEKGLDALLELEVPGGRKKASLNAKLEFDRRKQNLAFVADIEDLDPRIFSRKFEAMEWAKNQDFLIDLHAQANVSATLDIESAHISTESRNGTFFLPDLYTGPRKFEKIALDASYDGRTINIEKASVKLGGIGINARTTISLEEDTITAPLAITIPEMETDKIPAVFPDKLTDSDGHKWLVQRSSSGRFHDLEILLNLAVEKESQEVDLRDLTATFHFDKVTIDYQKPMMPAEDTTGSGRFSYTENRLVIEGRSARVGNLTGKNIHLDFKDIMTVGGGVADIHADVTGPFSSALDYVSREPIGLGDVLGVSTDKVKGNVDLKVHINFPTVKDLPKEKVKVKVTGKLYDVLLPGVVSGLDISGGPYDLVVEDGAFDVKGSGRLSGRDVTFTWKQYLNSEGKEFSSRVNASLVADKALRDHFGAGLEEYLSGSLPVDLIYTEFGNGKANIGIKADLKPVTVMFEPLAFSKPPGLDGKASVTVFLKNGNVEEIVGLTINAQDLALEQGRFIFGPLLGKNDVRKGEIKKLRMGENDFTAEFERTFDGTLKLSIKGDFLDARPFLKEKEEKQEKEDMPVVVSAEVNRMRTHPARMVTNVKLYVETSKTGDVTQLEMDAIAGKGDIYLRYKPDKTTGQRTFHLEAGDAGATLKAFDIYDKIEGGTLVIYGEPIGDFMLSGDLTGTVQLSDFKVVAAPGLAQLLSAMSLPGVLQLLNNEGVVFTRMEAGFDWLTRPQGSILVFKDGRTSGNALGLTFDGVIDRATNKIDVSGTIVPISGLNTFVSNIPLIGDILAGGPGGAIIAATYTIKGDVKTPAITVNPLAALTPGILRRILFE